MSEADEVRGKILQRLQAAPQTETFATLLDYCKSEGYAPEDARTIIVEMLGNGMIEFDEAMHFYDPKRTTPPNSPMARLRRIASSASETTHY